ncbi:MAG: hypothetical protein R3A13_02895 [Bdellovibrionota bacterium]
MKALLPQSRDPRLLKLARRRIDTDPFVREQICQGQMPLHHRKPSYYPWQRSRLRKGLTSRTEIPKSLTSDQLQQPQAVIAYLWKTVHKKSGSLTPNQAYRVLRHLHKLVSDNPSHRIPKSRARDLLSKLLVVLNPEIRHSTREHSDSLVDVFSTISKLGGLDKSEYQETLTEFKQRVFLQDPNFSVDKLLDGTAWVLNNHQEVSSEAVSFARAAGAAISARLDDFRIGKLIHCLNLFKEQTLIKPHLSPAVHELEERIRSKSNFLSESECRRMLSFFQVYDYLPAERTLESIAISIENLRPRQVVSGLRKPFNQYLNSIGIAVDESSNDLRSTLRAIRIRGVEKMLDCKLPEDTRLKKILDISDPEHTKSIEYLIKKGRELFAWTVDEELHSKFGNRRFYVQKKLKDFILGTWVENLETSKMFSASSFVESKDRVYLLIGLVSEELGFIKAHQLAKDVLRVALSRASRNNRFKSLLEKVRKKPLRNKYSTRTQIAR